MDRFPAQVRAARELLGFSQRALAQAAEISRDAVIQAETGRNSTDRSRRAIVTALSKLGIEFLVDTERGRYGVILHVKDDVLPG